jgi:Lamin Tail Domain
VGDCKKAVCDGQGSSTQINDDNDGPNDGDPCTADKCSNGAASHPPSAAGIACTQGGGVQCNGAGACGPLVTLVKFNEVESSGGVPGDWAELYNTSATITVDISGWIFKDSDDTHVYAIPAGTTIAPHGFLTLEEADFGFGLGASDAVRLFDASGTMLIDSYTWTMHAAVTYGRCPDGTGAFVNTTAVTKNAANACP